MILDDAALRALHPKPGERSLKKQLDHIDRHCAQFISISPFVVVASAGADGKLDASPRGGEPGFVQVLDEHTLLIPDSPGNNRFDSLGNIAATGGIGLLFLIPGVDETLRVNGSARLRSDAELAQRFANMKRTPKVLLEVTVIEAYLHCAKALLRSKLWDPQAQVNRSALPTLGEMITDQTGILTPPETREEMLARYAPEL